MKTRSRLPMTVLVLASAGFCAAACGNDTAGAAPDLPQGWEAARLLAGLRQTACEGSPYDGTPEAMTASVNGRSIHVVYEPAHFRCSQSVQAFAKVGMGTADVLVQPADMNPTSIAKCDCMYGVDVDIPVESGKYSVQLYRRWDHKSGSDGPVRIGSASVAVP